MSDPLAEAESRFRTLTTYQATVHSTTSSGEQQLIRYFYRKPGWVRLEFIQPHAGTVLIYDPDAHQVRVWPFGVKRFPVLTFVPGNPLVRSPQGQRIDHSDIGSLLQNIQALRLHGSTAPLAETQIDALPVSGLEITGPAHDAVAGVHRYRIWLQQSTWFPLRVESFGVNARLIETVDMKDVVIDPGFPEDFFHP